MPRAALLLVVAFCAIAEIRGTCDQRFPTKNVLCVYQPAPCNRPGEVCGLTDAQKQQVADAHNFFRTLVASGHELLGDPGPQPGSNDIKEIVYMEELAIYAQRWVEQNRWAHDCYECRATPTFEWVGQNLGMALPQGTPFLGQANMTGVVEMWFDEVKDMNKNSLEAGPHTGHYTQVVWGSTWAVGCGLYTNDKPCPAGYTYPCYIVACNYGPAGNWIGQKAYSTTINCPVKSRQWPRLCASGP